MIGVVRTPTLSRFSSNIMENTYVKANVGPILSEALTSLILLIPKPNASPLATTLYHCLYSKSSDPISFLGQYLLKHNQANQDLNNLNKKFEEISNIQRRWKEKEIKSKAMREQMERSLETRLSERRSVIEGTKQEDNVKEVTPLEVVNETPSAKSEQIEEQNIAVVSKQNLEEKEEES